MQGYIDRYQTAFINDRFARMPVIAILGSRQCGKSTLAKHLLSNIKNSIYLDLESNRDLRKLSDPETFFEDNSGKLVCIDEIQRRPDLFRLLRSIVDRSGKPGQVLIIGSASPDLLRQSSETLAGRIAFIELTPFLLLETGEVSLKKQWLKGGYPRSFLEDKNEDSFYWREDFIHTFLERDIPLLAGNLALNTIRRLWQMSAHLSGQVLNYSVLASSLSISSHTVKKYIDILAMTYMIRLLPPYFTNIKKRLVKSPKLYIRDTGILHALLMIETRNDLLGHPVYGASWESFVIEQILSSIRGWSGYFYRTSSGNEIDLILTRGNKKIAVECKASSAPELTKGFYIAREDLHPDESWIIAPVSESYCVDRKKKIHVGNPVHCIRKINQLGGR